MAPQIASQRMQIPAMDIHIRKRSRVVQNIKPVRKLRRVGGLYTSLAAGLKEVLDSGMPETLDHMLNCKPYIYSCHGESILPGCPGSPILGPGMAQISTSKPACTAPDRAATASPLPADRSGSP